DKQKKEQWNAALNVDLDTLSLSKLSGMAKELSINPDPLHPDNLIEIAKMLDLPDTTLLRPAPRESDDSLLRPASSTKANDKSLLRSTSQGSAAATASHRSHTSHPSDPNAERPTPNADALSPNGHNSALDYLDEALRHGIPHNVLNAKFHEKEAIII